MHTYSMKIMVILTILVILTIPALVFAIALDTVYCDNVDEIFTAFKTAQAGDRIIISPGIYYGNDNKSGSSKATFYCSSEGTQRHPIYVQCSDTIGSVILVGESVESDYVLYITGNSWVIDGLDIKTGKKGIMLDNSDYTVLSNVSVHEIGQEGIHIRDGSSYCILDNCHVYDTGIYTPDYGEGIYVGSAKNHWDEFEIKGEYNIIKNCMIGPDVRAESIDIKEGTVGTIVEYCTFNGTGISGNHYADSFIDAKGNNALIQYNTGYRNDNIFIKDAFQVHQQEDGWGLNNVFLENTVYMNIASTYLVNAASGSAMVKGNIRYPEGNTFRGDVSSFVNVLPEISIVSPNISEEFQIGELVTFEVDANDTDGGISFVDFYINNELIFKDLESPYKIDIQDLSPEIYTFKAISFDNSFESTESNTIDFCINSENSNDEKITISPDFVTCSADDGNLPANAVDGDLTTRWSASGDNQWIQFDLQSLYYVSYVKIAFYKGHQRKARFDLQFSDDGENWRDVLKSAESAGASTDLQIFNFPDDSCRYVRYLGHENSYNNWNSILEFEVWGFEIENQTVIENETQICKEFVLKQNYPNPFNPTTNISFQLNKKSEVQLQIVNIQGLVVENLIHDRMNPGNYNIRWNAGSYNSGVYFCRIMTGSKSKTIKMILVK